MNFNMKKFEQFKKYKKHKILNLHQKKKNLFEFSGQKNLKEKRNEESNNFLNKKMFGQLIKKLLFIGKSN